MNFFESKKALLEYCGKDGKDVRWLDRALKDGRIWICDGAYYIVTEYVAYLEKENGDLEEEMVKWRNRAKELEGGEKSEPVKVAAPVDDERVASLERELRDAKNNLTFQIDEYEELQKKMHAALEKCYDLMVAKKVVIKEKNPLSSFKKWALGEDLTQQDEEL